MADEEGQDLRSILSQVVADSDAAETAAGEETPATRPETPAREATETPESGGGGGDRPRGADGKFLSRESTNEGGEPAAPALDDKAVAGEVPPAPAISEPGAEVPQHWSQADKDLIAGLPKEHQAKVVERYKAIEAGFTPRLQKAAEIERQYQGAMEIFAPHVDGLRQRGQTPSDVIRAWASIEQDMMQGRDFAARGGVNAKGAEHVARMIQHYNIDPGAVAALLRGETIPGGQPASGNGALPTPQVPPELLSKMTEIEQRLNGREQAERVARETSTQSQIDAFANEKDAEGGLKHPYFSELERDMIALAQIEISQGKVPTIADLYDRAVYANRDTRSKVLAAEQAQATRRAAVERKAKAESAQRAASSISGAPGAGGSPAERQGNRTLREDIAASMAEVEAG